MKEKELHIYVRVSKEEQVKKGLSIKSQIIYGESVARRINAKPIIHKELGKSASLDSFKNRPVFESLINKVKNGEITNLFVFDISRLSRNDQTQATISKIFKDSSITLHTQTNGDFDFTDDSSKLIYSLLKEISQHDGHLRMQRLKMGNVQANRNGKYTGSNVPFGYDKNEEGKLIINEKEADAIRLMVDLYLNKKMGCDTIANKLDELNILTRNNSKENAGYTLHEGKQGRFNSKAVVHNPWNAGTIRTLFKNPLIKGQRLFSLENGEKESVNCPAIIDSATWSKIQNQLAINRGAKKRDAKYSYLLKGLLQCGHCEQSLHGRIKPSRSERMYRCQCKRNGQKDTCNGWTRNVHIDRLNNAVWSALTDSELFRKHIIEVHKFLDMKESKSSYQENEKRLKEKKQELENNLTELSGQEEKCLDLVLKEIIDEKVLKARIDNINIEKNKIDTKISEVNSQLSDIEATNPYKEKSEVLASMENLYSVMHVMHDLNPNNENDHSDIRRILLKFIEKIMIVYDDFQKRHIALIYFKGAQTESLNIQVPIQGGILTSNNPDSFIGKELKRIGGLIDIKSWATSFFFVPNCLPPFLIGLRQKLCGVDF